MNEAHQTVLVPTRPLLPDPAPPVVEVVFDYQQLRAYRLQSQPFVIRAHYDMVQWMLEDRILERYERAYLEWLQWIEANL